jgi:hypothetical protein
MKASLLLGACALVGLSAPVWAGMATGDQIKAAVAGSTIQGSMDSSGPYAEFYAEDGVVHGKDYKAGWSVEGDTMCWMYEGSPKDCWGVEIDGDKVKWIKDGKTQGTGTVVKGNPNSY